LTTFRGVAQWIDFLQICTAASHRDGLLSILEGGLTHFEVPSLPTTTQFTVAAQFSFSEPDTGSRHTGVIQVDDPDANTVALTTVEFDTTRPPGADLSFPYTVTVISNFVVSVDRDGVYVVRAVGAGSVREARFRIRFLPPS
jgi:hypothetical protein